MALVIHRAEQTRHFWEKLLRVALPRPAFYSLHDATVLPKIAEIAAITLDGEKKKKKKKEEPERVNMRYNVYLRPSYTSAFGGISYVSLFPPWPWEVTNCRDTTNSNEDDFSQRFDAID